MYVYSASILHTYINIFLSHEILNSKKVNAKIHFNVFVEVFVTYICRANISF